MSKQDDRQAFLNALKANEDDVQTRMVFSDWLDEHDEPEEAKRMRDWPAAKAWMVEFVAGMGPSFDYDEDGDYGTPEVLTYASIMEAATDWLDHGEYKTQFGSERWRDEFPGQAPEFWKRYAVLTGRPVADKDESFLSCSC